VKSFKDTITELLVESPRISQVVDSIFGRKIVKINYIGDDDTVGGERLIEPYLIGKTVTGKLAIRAYQRSGFTQTDQPDWKIFVIDKITRWEPQSESFDVRPDYNRYGDKLFRAIDKKIPLNKSALIGKYSSMVKSLYNKVKSKF
jgi:hypothetical protein